MSAIGGKADIAHSNGPSCMVSLSRLRECAAA